MYRGGLIAESIRAGESLESMPLVVQRIGRARVSNATEDQPPVWTLLEFEVDDEEAPALAAALSKVLDSPGWYTDMQSATDAFVVFLAKSSAIDEAIRRLSRALRNTDEGFASRTLSSTGKRRRAHSQPDLPFHGLKAVPPEHRFSRPKVQMDGRITAHLLRPSRTSHLSRTDFHRVDQV